MVGKVKRFLSHGVKEKQLITVLVCFNMPVLIAVEQTEELVLHTKTIADPKKIFKTIKLASAISFVTPIFPPSRKSPTTDHPLGPCAAPVFELLLRFVVDLQKGLRCHLLASKERSSSCQMENWVQQKTPIPLIGFKQHLLEDVGN